MQILKKILTSLAVIVITCALMAFCATNVVFYLDEDATVYTESEGEDATEEELVLSQKEIVSAAGLICVFLDDDAKKNIKEKYGIDIEAVSEGDISSMEQYMEDNELVLSEEELEKIMEAAGIGITGE